MLVLGINVRLRDSRVGRAWIALRDDEAAAASAGVAIARTKLVAYGTGAALGGIAGAFLASYLAIVNPIQFQFSFSILIFSMVVLGGLGSIRGVVAGAIALSPVNSYLLPDVLAPPHRRAGLRPPRDLRRRLRRDHRPRDAPAARRTRARTGGGRRRRSTRAS